MAGGACKIIRCSSAQRRHQTADVLAADAAIVADLRNPVIAQTLEANLTQAQLDDLTDTLEDQPFDATQRAKLNQILDGLG